VKEFVYPRDRLLTSVTMALGMPARDALATSYLQTRKIPDSLSSVGVREALPNGWPMHLDSEHMVLSVESPKGVLIFTPKKTPQGQIIWKCSPGTEFRPGQLPPTCR
jgi:hypothetical protein